LDGKLRLGYKPYLSLSGTSMAAPVVSGTIALMLEANPKLTPNLIKAILQYTANRHAGYSPLRQGAGFLDSASAVWVAWFLANGQAGEMYPYLPTWSRTINWGNHPINGGIINAKANAWGTSVVWGAATVLSTGDNITWGTMANGDNIVWGTAMAGDNITWGTSLSGDNITWGTSMDGDNITWGTSMSGDNIVWGTSTNEAFVWATSDIEDVLFNDDPVEETLPSVNLGLGLVVVPVPSTLLDSVSIGGL
jgi:subtilisin family serine protease